MPEARVHSRESPTRPFRQNRQASHPAARARIATPLEKVGSVSSQTNTTEAAFLRGVPLREVRAKRNQTQNTATLLSAEQRQVKERNGINGGDPSGGRRMGSRPFMPDPTLTCLCSALLGHIASLA